jgi:branched-chain amino acid aminotransferase
MLDGRGFVAETNATHLFAVVRGVLTTPRTVACPEGTTRETVLALTAEHGIEAVVRDVSLTEMYAADEVFCTGTMGEIAGVVQIDGRVIGGGEIGPVTRRIAEIYLDHARSSGTKVV